MLGKQTKMENIMTTLNTLRNGLEKDFTDYINAIKAQEKAASSSVTGTLAFIFAPLKGISGTTGRERAEQLLADMKNIDTLGRLLTRLSEDNWGAKSKEIIAANIRLSFEMPKYAYSTTEIFVGINKFADNEESYTDKKARELCQDAIREYSIKEDESNYKCDGCA
jgi:hypothetical protein